MWSHHRSRSGMAILIAESEAMPAPSGLEGRPVAADFSFNGRTDVADVYRRPGVPFREAYQPAAVW